MLYTFFDRLLGDALIECYVMIDPLSKRYVNEMLVEFSRIDLLRLPGENGFPTLFDLYKRTFELDEGVRFEACRRPALPR